MTVKIFKVRRAGVLYYAAEVAGVYVERTSLEALREAIAIRENFAKIFAEPVDTAS